jgi:hypothetical protein
MGKNRKVYGILIRKHIGKRPLERHRHRYKYNITMDFKGMRWDNVNWIHVAQCREKRRAVVNTVMSFSCHKMRAIS